MEFVTCEADFKKRSSLVELTMRKWDLALKNWMPFSEMFHLWHHSYDDDDILNKSPHCIFVCSHKRRGLMLSFD